MNSDKKMGRGGREEGVERDDKQEEEREEGEGDEVGGRASEVQTVKEKLKAFAHTPTDSVC